MDDEILIGKRSVQPPNDRMMGIKKMLFVVVFFAFILSCTAESWQNQLQNDNIVGDSHRILSHDMSNEEKLAAIETLLKTRSHYHTNRCGNWKDNYLQLYKELMNKPEKERFYVIAIPNLSGKSFRSLSLIHKLMIHFHQEWRIESLDLLQYLLLQW